MLIKLLLVSLISSSLYIEVIFGSETANRCYFDKHIKKLVKIANLTEKICAITNVTETEVKVPHDCATGRDERLYPPRDPERNKDVFELSVHLGEYETKDDNITTVLNVTISDITFYRLRMRSENMPNNATQSYSQTIEFEKDDIPNKISLFAPAWEGETTKIQFFAETDDDNFSTEYHFTPPTATDIERCSEIGKRQIFSYVDTTSRDKVYLHIQPLPEHFNITTYNVQFCEKVSGTRFPAFNISGTDLKSQHDIEKEGSYYFTVAPIDRSGNILSESQNTVAGFCMEPSRKGMVIAMVSVAATLILTSFACYILFRKLISSRRTFKNRKPNVLFVSAHTHDLHIDVMTEWAEHLKKCGINPMYDVTDVQNHPFKNPVHWCDWAFQQADVAAVISSPKENKDIKVTRTPHRDLDLQAMKLINAHRSDPYKRFVAVTLPYCTEKDLPIHAIGFRCFELSRDWKKFVDYVYGYEYTKLHSDIPDPQELRGSIRLAKRAIIDNEPIAEPTCPTSLLDICPSNENVAINMDENNHSDDDHIPFISRIDGAGKIIRAVDLDAIDLVGDGQTCSPVVTGENNGAEKKPCTVNLDDLDLLYNGNDVKLTISLCK